MRDLPSTITALNCQYSEILASERFIYSNDKYGFP